MHKVYFHHDKALSQTADLTTEYLEKIKEILSVTYIRKKRIPVKTANGSPLDFFGFGYSKQHVIKICARNLNEIWKIAEEVSSGIDLALIKKVFASWKRRLRLISANDGEHIEHAKGIHQRPYKK